MKAASWLCHKAASARISVEGAGGVSKTQTWPTAAWCSSAWPDGLQHCSKKGAHGQVRHGVPSRGGRVCRRKGCRTGCLVPLAVSFVPQRWGLGLASDRSLRMGALRLACFRAQARVEQRLFQLGQVLCMF